MDYRRQHGMAVKIARIFNTYGPRMHPNDGRVVSNFIMQALANEPITIYGDGMQTRSFCFVDDLIDGLARLMQTPHDFCGPVNLGNPVEFTMLQLAQEVIRLTGSSSRIEHRPVPCDDPVRRKPDIALSRAYLGWEPKVPLEQGLQRTIAYFMDLRLAMGREPQTSIVPGLAHH
jgi:UDP-glucuronate decarboxylase